MKSMKKAISLLLSACLLLIVLTGCQVPQKKVRLPAAQPHPVPQKKPRLYLPVQTMLPSGILLIKHDQSEHAQPSRIQLAGQSLR